MPSTLREQAERNIDGMKAVRQPWESDWRDSARLAMPQRSRFLDSNSKQWRSRANTALYDGHGIYAAGVCANGFSQGSTPESRPWFKLATFDDDLMKVSGVRDTLDICEERMYAAFARSNFYAASKTGYGEFVNFGTEVGVITESRKVHATFHTLTAGEYWIGQDDEGVVTRLTRSMSMTVEQCVKAFGRDKVSRHIRDMYDRGDYQSTIDGIWQMIEPNTDRDPNKIDSGNMPWRSLWWEAGCDKKDDGSLLRRSGFEEQPFYASRWDTTGNDVYGSTWPVLNALPDLRELQMQAKRKGEATDYINKPPLMGPSSIRVNFNPGTYTSVATADMQARPQPIWTVPVQAIQLAGNDIQTCREAVDLHLYVNLFLAISSMPGVQPRTVEEVQQRNEESITQLGAANNRSNNEKLKVVIDRMWGIMLRQGEFPDFPPEMQGAELRIDFVSPLAQLQQQVGLGAIERTAQFIGFLAGSNPAARDKLDDDEAIDTFAQRSGVPANVVRTEDETDHIRAARANQEQAAQAAAAMPAAKDGAAAAELLSRTQVAPGTALGNMVGA